MTDITLKDGRMFGFGDELSSRLQDTRKSQGSSWWKHFFEELRAGLKSPFESDWETKTGLYWKDWGKL